MPTSRFLSAPAVLAGLVAWLFLLPVLGAQMPEIPPPPRVPNDTAQYRRFTLENGMKVLLLSDAKLNKSSAALTADVGSLGDPKSRPGLAHFLEHMLFLGTKKFPDVADFDAYLKTNGGYNNAGTWGDRTTYMIEIPHAAFEGALDRFSQFFIAPLFDPHFTEREINAVNSEFDRHQENDLRRASQVVASLYRPGHVMTNFGIGNRQTLTGTTREELLAFYHAHYSANQMTLALTGRASLDELERFARTYFSPVEDRGHEPTRYEGGYLPEKAALRVVRIESVKDERSLNMEFPLPSTNAGWPGKSGELIGSILGYEGEGSLLSQLKAEGLATGLSAGAWDVAKSFASFEVQVELTEAGLANHQRVLELFFAAVTDLKRVEYPAYLFQERSAMARLDEAYRDRGEGADLAVHLSQQAWRYPLEIAEREPFLWLQEDPASYRTILEHLRPDNMLVALLARGLATDQIEPYYGTKYSYTEDAGAAYAALENPPQVATIHLPKPNPYIPTEVVQLPLQPVRLIDEPGLSLYYAQDTEFERPMVAEMFRLRLPRAFATLENATLLMFYEACVSEALNETIFTAGQAGLNVGVSADLEGGVLLRLDGYSAAAPRLLATVIDNLKVFELSEERFAAIKDRLIRPLEDFALNEAFQIAQQTRRVIAREFYFRPDEMLPVARRVSLAEVLAFAQKLYAEGRIEALVHGNVTAAAATATARTVAAAWQTAALPAEQLIQRAMLEQPPGDSIVTIEKVGGSNNSFRREYVLGGDDPEMRAANVVLSNAIENPVYTELRTRQQLGYIVGAATFGEVRTHMMLVLIQSGEYSAEELLARAEPVVAGLPDHVRNMSDEEWGSLVAGGRAQLEEKDKTIADRAARLFALAYDYDGEWGRTEATLDALAQLTQERAAEILATAIAPETRRMRTLLVVASDRDLPAEIQPTFSDRAAWKKTQTYR